MDNEKLYEDMKPKEKFEVLWAESGLADRPGAENLWQQMVALGFFEKPASIKHHSNHPGGLCEHSVCVAEAAMEQCRHTFEITHKRCAPCSGYDTNCERYEKTKGAADTKTSKV